jgi:hypothetical protein
MDALYGKWSVLHSREGFNEAFDQWLAPIVRQAVEAGINRMNSSHKRSHAVDAALRALKEAGAL